MYPNSFFLPFQDILGQPVQRLAVLDRDVAEELQAIAGEVLPHCQTYIGKTMCTYDFYEGNSFPLCFPTIHFIVYYKLSPF